MIGRKKLVRLLNTDPCPMICPESCKYVKCKNCKSEKLADYLFANGVIVLPCNVGDTIYIVNRTMGVVFEGKFRLDDFYNFRKKWFLSREEAERSLRGGRR